MAKVLITGATGFIGGHLAAVLHERGDDVRCLVRKSSRTAPLEALGVRCVVGDITAPASLDAALEGVEVVYHLAALLRAPWKPAFAETNTRGVENLSAACARQPRPPVLVLVSSLAAAGVQAGDAPRREEEAPAPVSRYGWAKLEGERAAVAFADRVPTTIVRPPMVLGEGDRVSLKLFAMAARGWLVVPRQERSLSYIHVRDLVEALILAAERGERVAPDGPAGSGIYFACDEVGITLPALGAEIAAALDLPRPRVVRVPDGLTRLAAGLGEALGRLRDRPTLFNLDKAREASAGAWRASPAKARRQLGFRCRARAERLRQTARWYREAGWLPGGGPCAEAPRPAVGAAS